jgi:pyruvate-formate lyase
MHSFYSRKHEPVGEIEGFFNSISMMNINVNIENPSMILEKLQNPQNQIINVAEA